MHAISLCRVIKRLISTLSQYANLQASHAAIVSQARNANAELVRNMDADTSVSARVCTC